MTGREIAFIERMTAGATHELLNTFAIIREASGLMDDILRLNPGGLSSWEDKAREALARIRRQVVRGAELSERLNGFAHGLAGTLASVELYDAVAGIALLMRHTARIRKVELRTALGEDSPVVSAVPLRLHMVLAAFIDHCLDLAEPGGSVTLRAQERDGAVGVLCEPTPPTTPAAGDVAARQRRAALEEAAGASGVELVFDPASPSPELLLPLA
jgi:signal transduction histidine kinase